MDTVSVYGFISASIPSHPHMAESIGFEPMSHIMRNSLAGSRFRPLSQLSIMEPTIGLEPTTY